MHRASIGAALAVSRHHHAKDFDEGLRCLEEAFTLASSGPYPPSGPPFMDRDDQVVDADLVTPQSVVCAPKLDVLRRDTIDFAYSSRPAEG